MKNKPDFLKLIKIIFVNSRLQKSEIKNMCGIVGYIGEKNAYSLLIKGLKRLEYRGYDSAGVALLSDDTQIIKKQGRVVNLEDYAVNNTFDANIGIGHTRWATHGEPSDVNAHPHQSGDKKISIVHNGIIENYKVLKQELEQKGHVFKSDTDTEVLVHFIEEIQKLTNTSLEESLRIALTRVVGAYAIVVVSEDEPNQLLAARKGSPLLIGVGKGEYYVASDATPIVEYTDEVIYLKDEEVAKITKDDVVIKTLNNDVQKPSIKKLDLKLETIEKGHYEHFMLKEIMEQPNRIYDSMRGRLQADTGKIVLGGMKEYADRMINARRLLMIACGTSLHAGMVGRYLFEDVCRVPSEVDFASEFRYRNPVVKDGDVMIALSQSGETADTLVAIEKAKEMGAGIFGICNSVGSSIARISNAGVYTHAGTEIGVASTKAFTAQLTALYLIGLQIAKEKGTIETENYRRLLQELESIPDKVQSILDSNDRIASVAHQIKDAESMLYLGRGYNYPIALEGALKMKEITYIHAEGYPAAEMKHGPIALIDQDTPVIFIAPRDKTYEKIVSNIQEIKARKGKVIAIVTEGDTLIKDMADAVLEIPSVDEILSPLLTIIPLQLLAYHVGVYRNCNIDQPRNLAKSVTVE